MRTATPILALALASFFYVGCGGGGSSGSSSGGGGGMVTHFSINAPGNIPSATVFNVTVTALDALNSRVTSYSGTVHFSSSDPHAQVPPDTKLNSGSAVLPVRLPTAGNQTIVVTDAGVSLTGTSNVIVVSTLADAFAVETFGAKGDGHTDDTAAIQSAIDAAAAAGGGSVVFKVARYFTTGSFIVPGGVILSGAIEGPFDVAGINPALNAVAPTLLVTNNASPFLTLNGSGSGVADMLFHYPNQVRSSAAAPMVYPYTIVQQAPGAKVVRSTVTNAYNFLDIELGRVMARDLYIGAFNNGIYIDHTFDFVSLQDIHQDVFWDEVDDLPYPQPIDGWVLSHGTALVAKQMDSLEIHNLFVFSRNVGMLLTYSSDSGIQGIRCALGTGSDITLEAVQYGIISDATNSPGFQFSNVQVIAAPGLGQAAVQLKAGGTNPPRIIITGGATEGNWALGAFPTPEAGSLILENVM